MFTKAGEAKGNRDNKTKVFKKTKRANSLVQLTNLISFTCF